MHEDHFHLGVKGLIKNEEGNYLVLKKNSKNIKTDDKTEFWDLPGGRKQINTNLQETLVREVEEETSIDDLSINSNIFTFVTDKRLNLKDETNVGLILTVFTCKTGTDKVGLSEEHTEYKWISKQELQNYLRDYPEEFYKLI